MQWNQRTIREWQVQTFGTGASAETLFNRMMREVRELSQAVDEGVKPKVAEEAADVTILLFALAEAIGADLLHEVQKKMNINVKRKWDRSVDGTSQHTEDPRELAA